MHLRKAKSLTEAHGTYRLSKYSSIEISEGRVKNRKVFHIDGSKLCEGVGTLDGLSKVMLDLHLWQLIKKVFAVHNTRRMRVMPLFILISVMLNILGKNRYLSIIYNLCRKRPMF